MSERQPALTGCLWVLLPTALLLFLGYLYLDRAVRDSYSGGWVCASSAEARQKKLLLAQYVVEPRVLTYQNYRVEFTDCWLEEKTSTEHDFIFFERIIRRGEPRLVLNYQGQRLTPDPESLGAAMLVPGKEGMGQDLAESEYNKHPEQLAYHQMADINPPDSIANDTVYFSILRTWSQQRNYLVKAYPRPAPARNPAIPTPSSNLKTGR